MKDLNDSHYQPDFEIADRYINFSSELLRLSLLGITGFGTFLLLHFREEKPIEFSSSVKLWMLISVICWSATASFSLAHRYFASDSMAYHIAYLRTGSNSEYEGRKKMLKWSNRCLIAAEVVFGIGVLTFSLAVFSMFIK